MLTWLGAGIVVLFAWLGVGLVALTLPGMWLAILVALLVDLWRPEVMSTWVIVAAIVLALLGEVIEFTSSAAGSRKSGGSRSGAWGAIVGSFLGLFIGAVLIPVPILGSIVGAVLGAGVGALAVERGVVHRTWGDSYRSGRGAVTGRALSIVIKTGIATLVAVLMTIDAVTALF
ncbi:MAG: DUF456 domain-containing protein [Phycisphaerales bacterium]|nr:DUF456 domain-containing protein [Planctomycetota bacterium]MCH8509484.1 DUF456 domain-containing protein [Phycisphaerales bacterium]